MGGYGSGRRRTRPVAEELIALRVRSLRRSLQHIERGWPRAEVALTWRSLPGTTVIRTGELHYQHNDALLLQIDSQAQPPAPGLEVRATPQPGGGRRWWLICPVCACRRGVLFHHDRQWMCGPCARVTYRSSLQSDARVRALMPVVARSLLEELPLDEDPYTAAFLALVDTPPRTGRAALTATGSFRLIQKTRHLLLRRLERFVPLLRSRRPLQPS